MIGEQKFEVNSLALPTSLVEAMNTGRWATPPEDRLRAVFPLEPVIHPTFFGLKGMERENRGWSEECLPSYLGVADGQSAPGDIDPRQSVVIADLGPDRLIALDYRPSRTNPSVVYLTGDQPSRWVQAAPDVETLLNRLYGTPTNGSTDRRSSPHITSIAWGKMEVEGLGVGRDFKLYPGGGREWNWGETNTHHVPGIQPADVQELIDRGCEVVVLTRGMQLVLQTCPETIEVLRDKNIRVLVEETKAAVAVYNDLVNQHQRVGGLFHSTC